MKICSHCGKDNFSGVVRCTRCKEWLVDAIEFSEEEISKIKEGLLEVDKERICNWVVYNLKDSKQKNSIIQLLKVLAGRCAKEEDIKNAVDSYELIIKLDGIESLSTEEKQELEEMRLKLAQMKSKPKSLWEKFWGELW